MQALEDIRRQLQAGGNDPAVWLDAGAALRRLKHYETGLACLLRAQSMGDDSATLWTRLGNMYRALGRIEDSLTAHEAACQRAPSSPTVHYNRAIACHSAHRFEAALAAYDLALSLKPDLHDAAFDRSLTLLMLGRLKEGFAAYESRWLTRGHLLKYRGVPRWDGRPLPAGQRLVIWNEQGHGDTLQFARYVPQIARHTRVVFQVQPALVRLFQASPAFADVEIVEAGQEVPDVMAHCPTLSLPVVMTGDPTGLDIQPPYVVAAPRLPDAGSCLKVGLTWAGSPTHEGDEKRTMRLENFLPLLDLSMVRFYSLQKGEGAAQLRQQGLDLLVQDMGLHRNDFTETAEAIAAMDLVISVDTSVVHLAGCLGKPVWVLLSHTPDWRWLAEGETSAWYPSMRLFRQTAPGDWASVMAKVRGALEDHLRLAQKR